MPSPIVDVASYSCWCWHLIPLLHIFGTWVLSSRRIVTCFALRVQYELASLTTQTQRKGYVNLADACQLPKPLGLGLGSLLYGPMASCKNRAMNMYEFESHMWDCRNRIASEKEGMLLRNEMILEWPRAWPHIEPYNCLLWPSNNNSWQQ